MMVIVNEVIVYRSMVTNIWANLALEDWIMQNVDLTAKRILFLWRNSISVVMGRHQNPWLETNVPLLRKRGVALARRRSGGGTVYHDQGNLNMTVFTHRLDYNRPRNLKWVCDALNEEWGSNLHVNKRDDILSHTKWKVSGSSARLVKDSAFHHFTLLLNVNQSNLQSFLQSDPRLHPHNSIATASKRAEVINLCSLYPEMSHDRTVASIANKFYQFHGVRENRKVVEVDPTSETHFPGIGKMQIELEEWKWVYGKTPKFLLKSRASLSFGDVEFSADIVSGIIKSCSLQLSQGTPSLSLKQNMKKISFLLKGKKFWRHDIVAALQPILVSNGVQEVTDISNWIIQLS